MDGYSISKHKIILQNSILESHQEYSPAPDDDVLRYLALTYASAHPTMRVGVGCDGEDGFHMGITNGAEWYPVEGNHF